MGRFVAAAVLSVAFGCLQPVSEADAGDRVLFTIHPNWDQLDGLALLYWGPQHGQFELSPNFVPGGIIASADALFVDGLFVPVGWDGGLLPKHSDARNFSGDPNCLCGAWLGSKDRVIKPDTRIGEEQLWLVPYTYEGVGAESRYGYGTGLPQTSTSFATEGATVFGPSAVRGSRSNVCVADRSFRIVLRDGGITPTRSTIRIYEDLAMTIVATRVDFPDAGADCIDATVAIDGGIVAMVGEFLSVYRQAWRIIRVSAGATRVEVLPDAQFCFPFKSSAVGSLRFACVDGQRVTAWQVDMDGSRITRSFDLPDGWRSKAALDDVSASVLALNADAGAAAICDEAGCVTLSEWTPNYISVGVDLTDSLLLASLEADGGLSVRRYPPQRWRR